MPPNETNLNAIRRDLIDGARNGDPACAIASLKEALAALEGATDPALEYLRECIGRMLAGEDARKAFNLGMRPRGRPADPLKPHRDAVLRWEVRQLEQSGMTVEEAVYQVAEKFGISPETVRSARWPR